jgi:hypothetical protein
MHPIGWKRTSKKLIFVLITALAALAGLPSAKVPSPGFDGHNRAKSFSFGLFVEARQVAAVCFGITHVGASWRFFWCHAYILILDTRIS